MSRETKGNPLLLTWQRLQKLPGGRSLFSYVVRRKVPYSGTIRGRIDELTPGYAKVRMADRRGLRNHLQSVHAIALTNLGELTSGLAMTAAMAPELRGIPVEINIEFLKKARGEITAESHCQIPDPEENAQYEAEAILKDATGDRVAQFVARWLIGPKD